MVVRFRSPCQGFSGKIVKKNPSPRNAYRRRTRHPTIDRLIDRNLRPTKKNFSEINQSIKNFMKFPQSNTEKYTIKCQHNMLKERSNCPGRKRHLAAKMLKRSNNYKRRLKSFEANEKTFTVLLL